MTLDVPTAVIAAAACGAIGWALRATVTDRIASLEASRADMGRRFGDGQHELDKRVAILEDRKERPHG